MMESADLFVAIQCVLSLAGLWAIYRLLYPAYLIDSLRQQLFELRDSLFDDAADGKISFDHPAYLLLRSTLNGHIRFAHKLSLFQVMAWSVAALRHPDLIGASFDDRLKHSMNRFSDSERVFLDQYNRKMKLLCVAFLLMRSPFLSIVLFVPLILVLIVMALIRRSLPRKFLGERIDDVDSAAMLVGGSEYASPGLSDSNRVSLFGRLGNPFV